LWLTQFLSGERDAANQQGSSRRQSKPYLHLKFPN
jgi:hypothetical protein